MTSDNSFSVENTPPDEINRELARRLRIVIAHLGISLTAFAESISMSKGYISDVTRGKKSVGILIPYRIRRRWNVNLEWFFTEEGSMILK